ncbi:hypothetical protein LWI29_005423 [Acer saccharum]|uniref:Gnk2-homologous domain-containing protein n=1 Tax=Acer saccharum TaxID=4024 RepID=A0AA39STG4_ACESA|nr:hypothetical protein LWI29_005423 [Acer saccharum]
MSSSRFFSSLYLLTFAFLLRTVFGAEPLFHFCSSSEKFEAGNPYEENLNKFMGYLYCKAPPTGFGRGVLGDKPNQTIGLALCRGDVSTADCNTCVVDASTEIRKRCPYNSAAVIFYDNCLLKYSNKDFYGEIDNKNKFYLWNGEKVSNPKTFNENTKELLSQLAIKAQSSLKLYAVGQLKVENSQTLYGLTQCTREMPAEVCRRCLDGIIGELPNCCDAQKGGRVVSGSCNFRYELYPFFNA